MAWSDFDRYWRSTWRDFERLNRLLSRYEPASVSEFPAVNMWTHGNEAMLVTELPGIDTKDIDISVVGKALTLRGSRQAEGMRENESYHRRERWYGQFSRTLELPFTIESDKVKARFSKGVLYITLPRAEAEKPRKITVSGT